MLCNIIHARFSTILLSPSTFSLVLQHFMDQCITKEGMPDSKDYKVNTIGTQWIHVCTAVNCTAGSCTAANVSSWIPSALRTNLRCFRLVPNNNARPFIGSYSHYAYITYTIALCPQPHRSSKHTNDSEHQKQSGHKHFRRFFRKDITK